MQETDVVRSLAALAQEVRLRVFRALVVALRREPRLHFTLEEINDTPVRQMPLFSLLREVGFSSSPRGLDWG